VRKAIEIAGSQAKLAELGGVSQQGISFALNESKQCSAELAVAIHRATDGQVGKHELRPDMFDAPVATEAAE